MTYLYLACSYNNELRSDRIRYYDIFLKWSFRGNVSDITESGIRIEGVSNNTPNMVGQEYIPTVSIYILDRVPDGKTIINLSLSHYSNITNLSVGDTVFKLPDSPLIKIGGTDLIVSANGWRNK